VAVLVPLLAASVALAGEAQGGEVSWLGIQLGREGDAALDGVSVLRVIMDSPAAQAGLRAKDVIVSVGGAPVSSNAELITRIREHEAGSWIPLTVSRKGSELDLRARLAERPSDRRNMRPRIGWIGVKAIQLPATLREHFGAPAEAGVMISRTEPGSPGEAAGFQLGDVVFELDGEGVVSPTDLYRKIGGAGVGNEIEFKLTRWGHELELESVVEAAPNKSAPGK
jgi:S1-C subfamily serine protease